MEPPSLTESQTARRERMLAVALELAASGGWDAVQMREVASGADVAIGTLYRYFPSKEHLLVSVMLQQIRALSERLTDRPVRGGDGAERVEEVLARANKALQAAPQVTTAMIKALVSGNTDVAPVVGMVRDEMSRLLSTAYAGNGAPPTGEGPGADRLRIELLSDIWLATLISWICGTESASAVQPRLAEAVTTLLD
ncbi:MAG: TetR family transcriptional regulator [Microthrixaceae bacterium]